MRAMDLMKTFRRELGGDRTNGPAMDNALKQLKHQMRAGRFAVFVSAIVACLLCVYPAQAQLIQSVAGNGTAGYSNDGGLAANAEVNDPFGVAVDPAGNIY